MPHLELPDEVTVTWRRWWQCAVHSHWALEVAYQSAVLVPLLLKAKAQRRLLDGAVLLAHSLDESQARFFVTTTSGTTTGGSWTASRCEIVQDAVTREQGHIEPSCGGRCIDHFVMAITRLRIMSRD